MRPALWWLGGHNFPWWPSWLDGVALINVDAPGCYTYRTSLCILGADHLIPGPGCYGFFCEKKEVIENK